MSKTISQHHQNDDNLFGTLSGLVFTLLLIFGMLIFLSGCSQKQPQIIYVKPHYPTLIKFEKPEPIILHAKNRGDRVCIREWNNSCIPKNSFKNLVSYIKELKKVILMYENEIDVYNRFAKENAKK